MLAFGQLGEQLVSGSADRTVRVWSWSAVNAHRFATVDVAVLVGHTGAVFALAVRPSVGLLASGSEDGTIRLWESGPPFSCTEVLAAHSGPVRALAVLKDGRLVSGSVDTSVIIWEGVQLSQTFRAHRGAVYALLAVDDFLWSAGGEALLRSGLRKMNKIMSKFGEARSRLYAQLR